ncbi:MAG: DHH family phosphoesterase [Candidatus Aenigmarchaeota archaeon]|nr:DHH family phosphoesterase [Candidatus Aenigmarchaeota archaeon]
MIVVEESVKHAMEFVKGIKSGSKVAIIHGHDNDSICSAAIMYKLLKDHNKADVKTVISEFNFAISESVLDDIRRMKPNYIIAVDLSDINVEILTELRNTGRVMIIDHHVPKGYVKITYVNPRVYDKNIYIPTTYLAYKIYEKFLDPRNILWIAGIGVLSDMGMKNCDDLFDNIKKMNKELVGDNANMDEILFEKSLLGKLSHMFNSARVVGGIDGSVTALNALIKADGYQDVLNGNFTEAKKILGLQGLVVKELNRLLKDFEKRGKKDKNLAVYEIKSKYNIKSLLASVLSKTVNSRVIVIYQKSGKYIDVSFRRGSSMVNLNEISNNSVKGMTDSNAGGHPVAAGARFPARYIGKFLASLKGI